jgi:hypothetical protein
MLKFLYGQINRHRKTDKQTVWIGHYKLYAPSLLMQGYKNDTGSLFYGAIFFYNLHGEK